MHRILVSNDDGVYASGLQAAAKSVQGLGQIVVLHPPGRRAAWEDRFPFLSRCATHKSI